MRNSSSSLSNLSIITDEVSPDLEKVVTFTKEAGLQCVDLRSVDGTNILDFGDDDILRIKEQLDSANLRVQCIASPVLKSRMPETSGSSSTQPELHRFQKALDVASHLGARYIRVFSYLKDPAFRLVGLRETLLLFAAAAKDRNCVVLLENEPICNIRLISELADMTDLIPRSEHLKILLDLGNELYSGGNLASTNTIKSLIPFIGYIHLKDFSRSMNRYVAVGDGDCDYPGLLRLLNNQRILSDIPLSIETHVEGQAWDASMRSVRFVKETLTSMEA